MPDNPLHRARIDRGIDLTELAVRTRLSPSILKQMDEGRFATLPAGIYARAYVRTFAAAVGLDPEAVLQALAESLPPLDDPLQGLRTAVAQAAAAQPSYAAALRAAAAVVDAAVLLTINAGALGLIAAICDVPLGALLEQGGAAIPMFCAIPVALYFLVFGGLGGRTPGAWICRLPAFPPPAPLRLGTILLRAVRL